jgi:hypothetical protein
VRTKDDQSEMLRLSEFATIQGQAGGIARLTVFDDEGAVMGQRVVGKPDRHTMQRITDDPVQFGNALRSGIGEDRGLRPVRRSRFAVTQQKQRD